MPDKCDCEGIIIRIIPRTDDDGGATEVESLVQTKDIILEEMPPPPTQIACNA